MNANWSKLLFFGSGITSLVGQRLFRAFPSTVEMLINLMLLFKKTDKLPLWVLPEGWRLAMSLHCARTLIFRIAKRSYTDASHNALFAEMAHCIIENLVTIFFLMTRSLFDNNLWRFFWENAEKGNAQKIAFLFIFSHLFLQRSPKGKVMLFTIHVRMVHSFQHSADVTDFIKF